jgi:hypothetical protein
MKVVYIPVLSYSASVVKIYNATNSIARFKMQNTFPNFKTLYIALTATLELRS